MDTNSSKAEYIGRVLKAQDFIEKHLDEELSLETVAAAACFSPFHFHRIYAAITGETPGKFIQRLRLHKAATLLIQSPRMSILEIALDCGFSGAAVFARAFQTQFGMSASAWRSGGAKEYAKSKNRKIKSNICKTERKDCKAGDAPVSYTESVHNQTTFLRSEKMQKTKEASEVRVVEDPAMTVAYVRHTGPYAGDGELFGRLFGRLCSWAGPRGFLGPDAKMLTIYHDNPELVDDDKLRISVCCTVPAGTNPDGDIGVMEMPGGKNVHAAFEVATDEYGAAWDWLFSQWMPSSGYQPDDRFCYELYLNDPKDHPEGKHQVEIVMPVRPL